MHSVRGHHYAGKYIYADIHTEKAGIKYPPTPQHGGPFSWHRTEMFQRVCESVTSKHREKKCVHNRHIEALDGHNRHVEAQGWEGTEIKGCVLKFPPP